MEKLLEAFDLLSKEDQMKLLNEIAFRLNMTVLSDKDYDEITIRLINQPKLFTCKVGFDNCTFQGECTGECE